MAPMMVNSTASRPIEISESMDNFPETIPMDGMNRSKDRPYEPFFRYVAPDIGFVPPTYYECHDIRHHFSRQAFHLRNVLRVVFSFSTMNALILSELSTFLCIYYGAYANIHPNLFLTVFVFPLAFSINAVYQRRERALDELATLKAAATTFFLLHQEWHVFMADPAYLEFHTVADTKFSKLWIAHNEQYAQWHLHKVYTTVQRLLDDIRTYLSTPDTAYDPEVHGSRASRVSARHVLLKRVYKGIRELSDANERLRRGQTTAAVLKVPLAVQPPILTRPIHWMYFMVQAFEKVRGIRDYRSPTTIRSFTKTLSWTVPLLLTPYYAYLAHEFEDWVAYFVCFFVTLILGSYRIIQDFGENPFLPIGEEVIDNLNLNDLSIDWSSTSLVFSHDPPKPPSVDGTVKLPQMEVETE
ncbi:hypothetical protein DIPPA_18955 [Diplonema papillatum]|nr:hypothetical protein DIPPA_18955 [Diplonema papillatum]